MQARSTIRVLAVLATFVLLAAACDDGDSGTDAGAEGRVSDPDTADPDAGAGGAASSGSGTIAVDTPTFGYEEAMPERHALAGDNISPPLEWEHDLDRAVELVLVVDDPDAPTADPFVHWLVAGIEPSIAGFDEGAVPDGVVEGRNGFGDVGWGGPAPPEGETHRYVFRLLALDAPSRLEEGFTRDDLAAVLDDRLIVSAETIGVFPG